MPKIVIMPLQNVESKTLSVSIKYKACISFVKIKNIFILLLKSIVITNNTHINRYSYFYTIYCTVCTCTYFFCVIFIYFHIHRQILPILHFIQYFTILSLYLISTNILLPSTDLWLLIISMSLFFMSKIDAPLLSTIAINHYIKPSRIIDIFLFLNKIAFLWKYDISNHTP